MKRIFCIILVVFILTATLTSCGLDVPRPEIKSGEFDFSVTYEYCSEIKTVSGVYVCEFDGIDWVLDGGYHRVWSGYVKDGTTEERIRLGVAENGGEVDLELFFDPDRFMGDYYSEDDEPFAPYVSVKVVDDEGMYFENDADRIFELYGARIIDYEYEEPIENTFSAVLG